MMLKVLSKYDSCWSFYHERQGVGKSSRKNPALVDVFSVGLVRCEHFCRVFLLGVLVQLVLTEGWI